MSCRQTSPETADGRGCFRAGVVATDVIAYLEPLRPNSTRVSFSNSPAQLLYTNLRAAPNTGFPVVLAWSPDGRRLASAAVEGLWIIEPEAARRFGRPSNPRGASDLTD